MLKSHRTSRSNPLALLSCKGWACDNARDIPHAKNAATFKAPRVSVPPVPRRLMLTLLLSLDSRCKRGPRSYGWKEQMFAHPPSRARVDCFDFFFISRRSRLPSGCDTGRMRPTRSNHAPLRSCRLFSFYFYFRSRTSLSGSTSPPRSSRTLPFHTLLVLPLCSNMYLQVLHIFHSYPINGTSEVAVGRGGAHV